MSLLVSTSAAEMTSHVSIETSDSACSLQQKKMFSFLLFSTFFNLFKFQVSVSLVKNVGGSAVLPVDELLVRLLLVLLFSLAVAPCDL